MDFRIRVYGIVQGVGFRPFVKREADRLGISGTVRNKGSYVEIMAHASEEKIRGFYDVIRSGGPERAVVIRAEIKETAPPDADLHKFEIAESEHREGEKFIPPDIGICDKCAEELFDPENRRYLHPFINCTQCGPRFTILKNLPYDRERTSMAGFPMCEKCAEEYHDKGSRRFDAQPVCFPLYPLLEAGSLLGIQFFCTHGSFSNASPSSAMMSSGFSSPMDSRSCPKVMPAVARASGV